MKLWKARKNIDYYLYTWHSIPVKTEWTAVWYSVYARTPWIMITSWALHTTSRVRNYASQATTLIMLDYCLKLAGFLHYQSHHVVSWCDVLRLVDYYHPPLVCSNPVLHFSSLFFSFLLLPSMCPISVASTSKWSHFFKMATNSE